jgi:hypothetical protein
VAALVSTVPAPSSVIVASLAVNVPSKFASPFTVNVVLVFSTRVPPVCTSTSFTSALAVLVTVWPFWTTMVIASLKLAGPAVPVGVLDQIASVTLPLARL